MSEKLPHYSDQTEVDAVVAAENAAGSGYFEGRTDPFTGEYTEYEISTEELRWQHKEQV